MQRLQRERRVADPGEAVVPVALAARRLGQRGRQRRDRGAGRHVGESLDRQRRALNQRTQLVIGDSRPGQPVAPELAGGVEPGVGFLDVHRRGDRVIPGQRAIELLALAQHMPSTHVIGLDPEQHVGLKRHLLTRARHLGAVAIARKRPFAGRPAVVERGLAHELDLDGALHAHDRAHQRVLGVLVGRRPGVGRDRVLAAAGPHRERLARRRPTGRRLPRCDQRVRARLIGSRRSAR